VLLCLVYAGVNEVLVLLHQLLGRFGNEWRGRYLRAGEERSSDSLVVCWVSYSFSPCTVTRGAFMDLLLLQRSPNGALRPILYSALGASLPVSDLLPLQRCSGYSRCETISVASDPRAGVLLAPRSFCTSSLSSRLWKRNQSIMRARHWLFQQLIWGFWSEPSCLLSLEPRRKRQRQSIFLSWIWQNCDTWKETLVMHMASFQARGQDCYRFVPLGRLAPHFI